jgi:hypothetical protein
MGKCKVHSTAYLSRTFLRVGIGFNLGCENLWLCWKQIVKRNVILCWKMRYRGQRIYPINNLVGLVFIKKQLLVIDSRLEKKHTPD